MRKKLKYFVNTSFIGDDGKEVPDTSEEGRPKEAPRNGSATISSLPKDMMEYPKWVILKNVILISLAFTFLFTSFQSMANLQSSINKSAGTASLSVLYAALVVSCAFLPTWLIKQLRVKWTLALCMLGYSFYIAAQFYPKSYTLIPGAILLGLGAAPMWSSKCTYLTLIGEKYAAKVGERSDVIITRFFGIFFLFFQASQVTGNLISSTVLSVGETNASKSDELLAHCGANFCPGDTVGNASLIAPPQPTQIYLMSAIYLFCSLVSSAIVAIFVDPLSKFGEEERIESNSGKSGLELLVATFHHMKKPYQVLIIPLTVWSGIEQAFIGADFTLAFVSCGLGVHMVGYVMIFYGVCDAICSVGFTPLIKMAGRAPVFVFGAVSNLVVIIVMIYWMPHPDDLLIFFIIAALWGTSDAIWQTQINALYGVIFPGSAEAAFSNYRLWESCGFIIAYVLSTSTCTINKIYLNVIILFLGMAGYVAIEILERVKKKHSSSD